MFIEPSRADSRQASVFFGDATITAAKGNLIRCESLIVCPELRLVDDVSAIVHPRDREVLISIQARLKAALELMEESFGTLTVVYPGRYREPIHLKTLDDIIIAYLTYFWCLVEENLVKRLDMNSVLLDRVLETSTEIGFAAPAFWTDKMLDRFLHQIRAAGWPSHCRIWSEPKCALAAHMAMNLADSQADLSM